ncbi:hypothetical protein EON66_02435 [archaeon]|nr:MAG: hypothetical protein EON66_02435 [archaeon]
MLKAWLLLLLLFVMQIFAHDPEIWAMQAPFTAAYRVAQGQAVRAYLAGRWADAKSHFEDAARALRRPAGTVALTSGQQPCVTDAMLDAPSRFVYRYMARHSFVAPATWNGQHSLA